MVGFLFAGQGSQYVGMGKDLFASFPESRVVFEKADKVLNFPISKLCFDGPQGELTETRNAQPAILTMTVACWEAYKKITNYKLQAADYFAGLSLGEYSALVAAEALTFEDALYLVRRRGEFMEEEARKRPGAMASVLGLSLEQVKGVVQEAKVEIANINSPTQIVISGGIKEINDAKKIAEAKGAKGVVILEVSGAFHSSFMKDAASKLTKELEKIQINVPKVPLVANVNAEPVTSAQKVKENLIQQVYSSVLWEASVQFMLAQGIKNFIEFGPGKVLRGLMRRINPEAQVGNIEKSEDVLALKGRE